MGQAMGDNMASHLLEANTHAYTHGHLACVQLHRLAHTSCHKYIFKYIYTSIHTPKGLKFTHTHSHTVT